MKYKSIKKIASIVLEQNEPKRIAALAEHRKRTRTARLVKTLTNGLADHVGAPRKAWIAEQERIAAQIAAEKAENYSDWTRALIRDVQLQAALGGAETAVRSLKQARWPNDAFSQLVLEL